MAISKIILNGVTQMDVTDTTATAQTVEAGLYFYGADGEKTLGTGSGGGDIEPYENDVTFIDDYTGKIVYAYTANEFASLSEMPANPTHPGMTSQGWNWTLADAKTYVANYGKLWIGQQYVTTSGDTEIDIYLEQGRTSPYLGLAVNGSVSVDWGDDTTPTTITGTSLSTQIRTLHNYPNESAPYAIKISVVNGSFAFYGSSTYPVLSGNESTLSGNRVYANSIQSIRMGTNVSLSSFACSYCSCMKSITLPSTISLTAGGFFSNCYNLKSMTIPTGTTGIGSSSFTSCYGLSYISIPKNISAIGNTMFLNCYAFKNITIPSTVTSIGTSSFSGCYLSNFTIPSEITSIGASAFSNCYGLGEMHFAPSTPPTVSNSNTFNNLPTDCIIYVPYSADHSILNNYKTESNYPDPNIYTYMEESA